jgi:hypothetical protein
MGLGAEGKPQHQVPHHHVQAPAEKQAASLQLVSNVLPTKPASIRQQVAHHDTQAAADMEAANMPLG